MSDIARQIWDMKYRFKAADGTPVDHDVADSWARVALATAGAEAPEKRREWALAFAEALAGHRFLPAGRILAGAGTERNVTLFNCFVMGAIPDDMGGIFAHLREAALTMQQGGGIGYDFSTLRPRGAPVKGVGADASGPVSFMEVWDAMCRTIMSAGSRRGAMMATLACDHPDIEEFVEAKRAQGRLAMFNLSVLASDAFMDAVKADAPWELKFEGKVFKTLRARELWERIMRATYEFAEPGVIFIDRINRENNLAYCETIRATNPCLTADTWIFTTNGPRQIDELVGSPFAAIAEGRIWPSDERGFFPRGVKPVIRLRTREGHGLTLTCDHLIRKVIRRTRWSSEWEWMQAGVLAAGDEILLHDHRDAPHWGGDETAVRDGDEGYLLGLLIGDGVLKEDKAVLSVWPGRRIVNGSDGIGGGEPAAPSRGFSRLGRSAESRRTSPSPGRPQETRARLRPPSPRKTHYGRHGTTFAHFPGGVPARVVRCRWLRDRRPIEGCKHSAFAERSHDARSGPAHAAASRNRKHDLSRAPRCRFAVASRRARWTEILRRARAARTCDSRCQSCVVCRASRIFR